MRMAAPSGIPRKTPTLVATVEYDTLTPGPPWLITLMKRRASGAKRTIWRKEFTATRIAQYSLSPPAYNS